MNPPTGHPPENNLHQGTKADFGSIDIDEMIERSPCAQVYLKLEDCLIESNRSWKKCQQQVLKRIS